MTDACLIVNPVAGGNEAGDLLPVFERRLRAILGDLRVVVTRGEGDGERAGRLAVTEGCSLVVVGGGDGTLNEALNGVAAARGLDQTVFGLIPLGTGNDFAGVLGLPEEPEAALEVIAARRERRVDAGTLNGRLFVNASAGGFLAEVSEAVTPSLKTIAGRLAYIIGGASALVEFEPPAAEAEVGEERLPPGRCHLFVVSNGETIGGGHKVAPRARLDDGLLDACVVEATTSAGLLALLRRMSSGEHLDDPLVTYRQFRQARLSFDRLVKVNTDGEVLETTDCRYEVVAGAVRFLT